MATTFQSLAPLSNPPVPSGSTLVPPLPPISSLAPVGAPVPQPAPATSFSQTPLPTYTPFQGPTISFQAPQSTVSFQAPAPQSTVSFQTQAPQQFPFSQAPQTSSFAPSQPGVPRGEDSGYHGGEEVGGVGSRIYRIPNYSDWYFALYGPGLNGYEGYMGQLRSGGLKNIKLPDGLTTMGYLFRKSRWAPDDLPKAVDNIAKGLIQPGQVAAVPAPTRGRSRGSRGTQFMTQAQPTFTQMSLQSSGVPVPAPLTLVPSPSIREELEQQTITYSVPLPKLGQKVYIGVGPTMATEVLTVTSIESPPGGPVDHVKATTTEGPSRTIDLVVVNGRFQILGSQYKHVVSFE